MLKIIKAGSWNGPGMEQPVTMIKVPRGGLRGHDLRTFLEKRAGDASFAQFLKHAENLKPGDVPIHFVAIGSTEAYGPNRNGDGFNEQTCKEVHASFRSAPFTDPTSPERFKGAKFYRNHRNREPNESYGYVKDSAYNPQMRRIELLIIGNGTKEAAERNGGKVLAPDRMHKLANGEFLAGSMACRVAHDVCCNCHNKAANRSQYCTEETCYNEKTARHGFGCRDGLTKVADDGFIQYVENPGARMFDFSDVHDSRPADRTAYGGLASYLQKTASDHGRVLSGAELAELYAAELGANFGWTSFDQPLEGGTQQLRALQKLAALEAQLLAAPTARQRDLGHLLTKTAATVPPPTREPGTSDFAGLMHAMAQQRAALSPREFCGLLGQHFDKLASCSDAMAAQLPGVFGRLLLQHDLAQQLAANPFTPDRASTSQQQLWAKRACRLRPQVLLSAAAAAALSPPPAWRTPTKQAADHAPLELLAQQYALYKVALLASLPEQEQDEAAELLAIQNFVQ